MYVTYKAYITIVKHVNYLVNQYVDIYDGLWIRNTTGNAKLKIQFN